VNGVPITLAQRLLGHSTVEMTARVYTHLGEEQMRSGIDRIDVRRPIVDQGRAMMRA
jgi:integrase